MAMTLTITERTRRVLTSPFEIVDAPSKVNYALLSLVAVLALRMLENAVHEHAHAAVVLLSGGEVVGLPMVTPFGGFTRWDDVPSAWLPAVNIAGTLVSVVVLLAAFLPVYLKAKRPWARWIGYWGACVVPVNAIFYWFAAPFLATAQRYDPVAFAYNVGLEPVWLVGAVAAAPFSVVVAWMVKATRDLHPRVLADPRHFHVACLVVYYAMSLGLPLVSYAGILDEFAFWGW
ncbi:MAG: M50 family metallopeptidase [Candidatus Lokiarchaeota archaeon]|nr:M50 family metallopeptidase [Candidatus Lokiarchaeota archaeon]